MYIRKVILLLTMLSTSLVSFAQQQQEHRRSTETFVFPEFQEAKVLQTFGRSVRAKVNIFLKDAALYFVEDSVVKKAYTQHIIGVQFDSVKYLKVDSIMGEVLSSRKYTHLVRVTTIDMDKLRAETTGGENLPYFQIEGVHTSAFYEIEGQIYDEKGYPLKDKYYFLIRGNVVPAIESKVKPYVRPEMREAFKNLMGDRFWSWSDPKSLKMLLDYLPE